MTRWRGTTRDPGPEAAVALEHQLAAVHDLAADLAADLAHEMLRDLAGIGSKRTSRELADVLAAARDLAGDRDVADDVTDIVDRMTAARPLADYLVSSLGLLEPDRSRALADGVISVGDFATRLAGDHALGAKHGARTEDHRSDRRATPPGRVTRALLTAAVRQLPGDDQQRYEEEWRAESHDQPRRHRWVHGLHLVARARSTGLALEWRPESWQDEQRPW